MIVLRLLRARARQPRASLTGQKMLGRALGMLAILAACSAGKTSRHGSVLLQQDLPPMLPMAAAAAGASRSTAMLSVADHPQVPAEYRPTPAIHGFSRELTAEQVLVGQPVLGGEECSDRDLH